MVGSELLTGLSAAVGVTDQLFLDSGSTLDKVGRGPGHSGVCVVPAERLPELRELRDVMFSWMRPVAVLTSQFFLSDEEGELEMPLRINGGRASLQQEMDFNYCYICPQKIKQAERVGPAVNRWDCHRIIDIICWLCKWLNIPKLGPRNGLCELHEKYKWKSCTGTVPLLIQSPGGDSEVSGSPCLRTQEETTGSVDRKGQYDDAVKVSAFGYPTRLVKNTDNRDITWIRLTCVWFHNCQAGRIVMSSSKLMPVVTRPRTTEEVPSQPPETFLKHVSDSHLDKLYDLPENILNMLWVCRPYDQAQLCAK